MAGAFTPTGSYSNLTRLELEQLRKADFVTGNKALTIGDSALPPEGVVGKGNINAEPFFTNASLTLAEANTLDLPSEPGKLLGKTVDVYPGGNNASWVGPTDITFGGGVLVNTDAGNLFTDPTANFVVAGVLPGDILLIEVGGLDSFVCAVISAVSTPQILLCGPISPGPTFNAQTITAYDIVRPNAVQLFADPGSGPVGQEQTFLCVIPGSTLHNTVGPTVDAINTDRLKNLVQPKYALNSTVDRADSVFPFPAPHTALSKLGYRIILYPDDGTGTAPDLTSPITSLNPVIDPAIPADDQRLTIDYAAGIIRFSCAPTLGGQIKVPGGVNVTTGRLNLYAVFWSIIKVPFFTQNTAQSLYFDLADLNTPHAPARIYFDVGPNTWILNAFSVVNGVSEIRLSGITNVDTDLHVMEFSSPTTTSLVKKANAELLTVGDSFNSFGDFNGPDAIDQALAFWQLHVPLQTSLVIHVKSGAYTLLADQTIPASNQVKLIGAGSASTSIVTANAGVPFTVASGARLTFEDLTMTKGASTAQLVVSGSIRANRCVFNSLGLKFLKPFGFLDSVNTKRQAVAIVNECTFDYNAGLTPLILCDSTGATANDIYSGLYFNDCRIVTPTDFPKLKFLGAAAVSRWEKIAFTRCLVNLQSTADSGTGLTANCGVVEIAPNGFNKKLVVSDVSWVDCDVNANYLSTVNNNVLMQLIPLAHGQNGGGNAAILGTFRIKGGFWKVPSALTVYSSLVMMCSNPVVEDVVFQASGTNNGKMARDVSWAFQNSATTITEQWWCGFFISASGIFLPPPFNDGLEVVDLNIPMLLRMRNVNLINCGRKSLSGDMYLVGPNPNSGNVGEGVVDVDGVTLSKYVQYETGVAASTVPNVRLRIDSCGAPLETGLTPPVGFWKNISVIVEIASSESSTNGRWVGRSGTIGAYIGVTGRGHLRGEEWSVFGGKSSDGFTNIGACIHVGPVDLNNAGFAPDRGQQGVHLKGGRLRNYSRGILVDRGSSSVFADDCKFEGFNCFAQNAIVAAAIACNPFRMGHIVIANNYILHSNGGDGIGVFPLWNFGTSVEAQTHIVIRDNHCSGCGTGVLGAVGIFIASGDAFLIRGHVYGNSVWSGTPPSIANLGSIQASVNTLALATPASWTVGTTGIWGLQTDYIGGAGNPVVYTNGNVFNHNQALLKTP